MEEKFPQRLIGLAALFFFALLLPTKGSLEVGIETRLLRAVFLASGYSLVMWLSRGLPEKIFMTADLVVIGAGRRGAKRIRFDAVKAISVEEFDGYRALVVRGEDTDESERIYLDPVRENEIKELLSKIGRLKTSA